MALPPPSGSAEPGPVRRRPGDRLSAAVLYAVLTLRADVLVVEQQAPYRELDGADLAVGTTHLWVDVPAEADARAASDHEPALGPLIAGTDRRLVATARLVAVGEGADLGRVVVASAQRGRGLGTALVKAGCELGARPLHVNAQAHLEAWYATLGFVAAGPTFDWDGIAHVPMRLSA